MDHQVYSRTLKFRVNIFHFLMYKRMANRPKDLITIHKKIMNLESKIRKKRKQESLAASSDADTDSDMPAGNCGRGINTEQDSVYEQVVCRAQQQRHTENSRNFMKVPCDHVGWRFVLDQDI